MGYREGVWCVNACGGMTVQASTDGEKSEADELESLVEDVARHTTKMLNAVVDLTDVCVPKDHRRSDGAASLFTTAFPSSSPTLAGVGSEPATATATASPIHDDSAIDKDQIQRLTAAFGEAVLECHALLSARIATLPPASSLRKAPDFLHIAKLNLTEAVSIELEHTKYDKVNKEDVQPSRTS